jgi:predicted thioredoxin/glutaredoxin
LNYSTKVLENEIYLSEIGDKLIKLAVQFVIRHLNWVMDKINEKKTMSSERLLFILEDLSNL